jgi:hypothetical protein
MFIEVAIIIFSVGILSGRLPICPSGFAPLYRDAIRFWLSAGPFISQPENILATKNAIPVFSRELHLQREF